MDKLKKTIELIESHQNTLGIYVVDPCVNLTVKEMFDVLISEIERLRGAIIKTVQDAEVREEKLDKETERVRKEAEAAIETLKGENEKLAFENDRLRKEKDDLVLVNKGQKALTGAQFSCMEKLEKEKEWLIRQYLYQIGYGAAKTEKEARERFEEIMQQALKESGR